MMTTEEKIGLMHECAKLVCSACAGHLWLYDAHVTGPNVASNYVHLHKKEPLCTPVLCRASAIFHAIRVMEATADTSCEK